jgi:hypothetical protein
MAGKPPLLPIIEIGAELCTGDAAEILRDPRISARRLVSKRLDEVRQRAKIN